MVLNCTAREFLNEFYDSKKIIEEELEKRSGEADEESINAIATFMTVLLILIGPVSVYTKEGMKIL